MPKATMDVSCELLRELLHLPDTVEILYSVEPRQAKTVRLVIDGPFTEVPQGSDLPRVTPTMRKEMVPSTVTLVDWTIWYPHA